MIIILSISPPINLFQNYFWQHSLAKDSDIDKLMSHLLQTKTTWDKWRWTGPYKRIINHINQEKSQTGGRQKKMYNWWSRAYDDKNNKNPQTIDECKFVTWQWQTYGKDDDVDHLQYWLALLLDGDYEHGELEMTMRLIILVMVMTWRWHKAYWQTLETEWCNTDAFSPLVLPS